MLQKPVILSRAVKLLRLLQLAQKSSSNLQYAGAILEVHGWNGNSLLSAKRVATALQKEIFGADISRNIDGNISVVQGGNGKKRMKNKQK